MTREKLYEMVNEGELRYSHTSLFRGYVSRKKDGSFIQEYKGKFGRGFVLKDPNWNSTTYSYISYFLFDK